MSVRILTGDVRDRLKDIPDASVHCVVTSPPYWGLRDYGVEGQLGLEPTPEEYTANMVDVFREVRRVLRNDGTVWLNLGDSYANNGVTPHKDRPYLPGGQSTWASREQKQSKTAVGVLKPKDLVGTPWRVAFALQADGWWLRQEIIWAKPNPMPESVRDRCTKSHEQIFLLSKRATYYFDQEAIAEPVTPSTIERLGQPTLAEQAGSDRVPGKTNGTMKAVPPRFGGSKYGDNDAPEHRTKSGNDYEIGDGKRNKRSVWTITTQPFPEAHFATFPPALVDPCIKAGCPEGGIVLDPFGGAGTTGLVADRLGRNAILIELNPEYAAMAERRIGADAGLFAEVDAA